MVRILLENPPQIECTPPRKLTPEEEKEELQRWIREYKEYEEREAEKEARRKKIREEQRLNRAVGLLWLPLDASQEEEERRKRVLKDYAFLVNYKLVGIGAAG